MTRPTLKSGWAIVNEKGRMVSSEIYETKARAMWDCYGDDEKPVRVKVVRYGK